MPQTYLRSFHLLPESGPAKNVTWFQDCDAAELSISPQVSQSGAVRITLASHHGPMTIAWTRLARCENGLSFPYGSWRIAGAPAMRLCNVWHQADIIRLAYADDQPMRLEVAGVSALLGVARYVDRTQWADSDKWAAQGDPIFQVRIDAWRKVLRVLRGPGRTLHARAEADILIQGHLPISINDVDLSGVRILNLRRVDVNIRADVAARCSPSMIETVGMRFSLSAMVRSVGLLDGMPDETLVRVGFDPDIGCSWVSVGGDPGNRTVLHVDPKAKLHSATPAAILSRFLFAHA